MRNYYAVSYDKGSAVCALTGKRYLAAYHSFPLKKDRDEWVEGGGDFKTSRDWREAIPSRDPELRAVQREPAFPDPYRDQLLTH